MVTASEILAASILIVDDQESNVGLLEELLRQASRSGACKGAADVVCNANELDVEHSGADLDDHVAGTPVAVLTQPTSEPPGGCIRRPSGTTSRDGHST